MTSYDNTNTFVLFQNDKGDNAKRPDQTGTMNFEGIELEMAGWVKQGAKGPFLSGKLKRKDAQGAPKPPAPVPAHEAAFVDDDLPF